MPVLRRSVLARAPALAFVAASGTSSAAAPLGRLATDQEVAELVRMAEQAHEALMRGDMPRYRSLLVLTDDFTLMSPFGGKPSRGNTQTDEQWDAIGRFFRNGRDSTAELVQSYRAVDHVMLALIERSHVEVGGLPAQDWALRVTLVFRHEGGRWRLAHRHADALAGGMSLTEAAAFAGRALAQK